METISQHLPQKNVIHLHKQIIENLEHGPSSHLSKHLLLRHSLWPTGRCELPNCLDAQWSAPTIVPETVGVIMVGVATQRKIKSIQHFLLVISGILLDTQLWSHPASRKNIVIHWSSCVQLNSSSIFIRNPAMPFPPCRHLAIQLAPSIAWSCDGSSGSSAWTPFGSCDWCFSAPWLQGTSSGRWDGVKTWLGVVTEGFQRWQFLWLQPFFFYSRTSRRPVWSVLLQGVGAATERVKIICW